MIRFRARLVLVVIAAMVAGPVAHACDAMQQADTSCCCHVGGAPMEHDGEGDCGTDPRGVSACCADRPATVASATEPRRDDALGPADEPEAAPLPGGLPGVDRGPDARPSDPGPSGVIAVTRDTYLTTRRLRL